MKTREPLLIWSSTLAALQVIAGGAALGDVIGIKAAGLFILVVAALQVGTSFYVRGQVVPTSTVAVQRDPDGALIAGPAAAAPTGAEVYEPTEVHDGPEPPPLAD